MSIHTACEEYIRDHDLAAKAELGLIRSCRLFVEFTGSDPNLSEITESRLSMWVRWMQRSPRENGRPFAARTVVGHRANVLTVLRYACVRGQIRELSTRQVRRPKTIAPRPSAWSPEQFRRVLAAAASLPGNLTNGVPRALYFESMARVVYDSGIRRSDCFTMPRPNDRGVVDMTQSKTGTRLVFVLRQHTAALVRQLPGEYPLQWPQSRGKNYYHWWHRITDTAGVPRGAGHQIRRTGATMIYQENRNTVDCQQYLGHQTADMWRHYVDRSSDAAARPQPKPV